jgi:hypothetical protein
MNWGGPEWEGHGMGLAQRRGVRYHGGSAGVGVYGCKQEDDT